MLNIQDLQVELDSESGLVRAIERGKATDDERAAVLARITAIDQLDGIADCDLVIDTTELNVHQLKTKLVGAFEVSALERLQVSVESFGFKHGLPLDADIVMDVRFLPNPHWEEELRALTGLDIQVRDFVLERQECSIFVNGLVALLESVLPHYAAEGKSYLTIAIGCTGGHHRSVAVAEEIGSRLRSAGQPVRVSHRDISR